MKNYKFKKNDLILQISNDLEVILIRKITGISKEYNNISGIVYTNSIKFYFNNSTIVNKGSKNIFYPDGLDPDYWSLSKINSSHTELIELLYA